MTPFFDVGAIFRCKTRRLILVAFPFFTQREHHVGFRLDITVPSQGRLSNFTGKDHLQMTKVMDNYNNYM